MFVFYDWPFPHMCRLLCKECSLFAFLILGSVFSDCVVFYGDTIYVPHFPTSPAHCDNANGLLRRHSGSIYSVLCREQNFTRNNKSINKENCRDCVLTLAQWFLLSPRKRVIIFLPALVCLSVCLSVCFCLSVCYHDN